MENYQLDVEGQIIQVGEQISGTTKSGVDWKKVSVIVKSQGEYPKEIEVSMYNDLVQPYSVGDNIKFKCNVESRNHNGRYFTEVKAYKTLN
jgi:hypothetical protein